MNKKPFFTILVSGMGAFFQQGSSLAAGFNKLNYRTNVVIITRSNKEEAYKQCRGDLIISVGSWRDWSLLYRGATKQGKRVIPWLVSDDKVQKYIIKDINKVPALFVPSSFCKHTFEKAGGKRETIQIIPEGIDTDFWRPVSKQKIETLKYLLALPKHDKKAILLTIGGEGTSKGTQEVLLALKKMPFLNVLYLIKVWDTTNSFFLGLKERKIIDNFGLKTKNKVRYIMGYLSNEFIRDLINLCDIYVSPSRHEGFGLPHIQAMACGKPVITCRGTAAEETSLNKLTGYIVSSRSIRWRNVDGYRVEGVKANVKELKEVIKNLVKNHKLRKSMGRKARRHVRKNYESKVIARLFLKKIKKLFGGT